MLILRVFEFVYSYLKCVNVYNFIITDSLLPKQPLRNYFLGDKCMYFVFHCEFSDATT